jgi:SAM-dependent methyltransferase
MTLAEDYRRQFTWRSWPQVLDALPPLRGATVLDLGCGVGDLAAEFVARGARVVGLDLNEELLEAARARELPGAEFFSADLRRAPDLGQPIDGVWSSFSSAYFTDLSSVLPAWTRNLRPGGWIALTEIDDLFGHEPLSARTRDLLQFYARDALAAERYDFHMGRKLGQHLEAADLRVTRSLSPPDLEFAFDGPARPDVLEGWRMRLERMPLLRDACGSRYAAVRNEFLACLEHPEHRATSSVRCCIAVKPELP